MHWHACRTLYPRDTVFTFKGLMQKVGLMLYVYHLPLRLKTYTQKDMGFSDHDLIMTKIIFESTFDRGAGI